MLFYQRIGISAEVTEGGEMKVRFDGAHTVCVLICVSLTFCNIVQLFEGTHLHLVDTPCLFGRETAATGDSAVGLFKFAETSLPQAWLLLLQSAGGRRHSLKTGKSLVHARSC